MIDNIVIFFHKSERLVCSKTKMYKERIIMFGLVQSLPHVEGPIWICPRWEIPFNLAPFLDQTEILAFGLARLKPTRLLSFCSVSNSPYKFENYLEESFSTLKTPFR